MDEYTISRAEWRKHRKYVRRLRRKLIAKSLALHQCQDELRKMSWYERRIRGVIADIALRFAP